MKSAFLFLILNVLTFPIIQGMKGTDLRTPFLEQASSQGTSSNLGFVERVTSSYNVYKIMKDAEKRAAVVVATAKEEANAIINKAQEQANELSTEAKNYLEKAKLIEDRIQRLESLTEARMKQSAGETSKLECKKWTVAETYFNGMNQFLDLGYEPFATTSSDYGHRHILRRCEEWI
jgi:vacuolar-type H+-ATPase subunit H